MGYTELSFQLPTDYRESYLRLQISQKIRSQNFHFSIISKSLDARKKSRIIWQIRVGVSSPSIKDGEPRKAEKLVLPDPKSGKGKKVTVIGCGPAGVFSGLVLQMSGFDTTIIEKGRDVSKRTFEIAEFEKTGILQKNSGYCFGEGGAGTFSDGKLTSRTKSISAERQFIFDEFIKAGAPEEISYLKHPHLGSDNLKKIFPAIVRKFENLGGKVLFNTEVKDFKADGTQADIQGENSGQIDSDYLVIAPGHSSYELYRLLINKGIRFTNKPFAIGFRVEHLRREINLSQWSRPELPGVKAAEYRLATKLKNSSAFTFCMCPGGKIVQATPKPGLSVVNGMSDYSRDGKFSNSAVVTSFNIEEVSNRDVSCIESLEIMENLERNFYRHTDSYDIPAVKLEDLINNRVSSSFNDTSYDFKLVSADFRELFDHTILNRLIEGVKAFNRKLKYFSNGTAMGLESKTSAPLRTLRNTDLSSSVHENIFIVGEGSGNAGGIVSSASDGIKAALSIARKSI
jgi:uncharacterized FAD-dependent dehydrogenase